MTLSSSRILWLSYLACSLGSAGCEELTQGDVAILGAEPSRAGDSQLDWTPEADPCEEGGADGFMYAHSQTSLYEVEAFPPYDLSLVAEFWGDTEADVTDLAIDHCGRMYATTIYAVYSLDHETGELRLLPRSAEIPEALVALTVLADGAMLVGAGPNVYVVSPVDGAFERLGSIEDRDFAGDMVGLPDGQLACFLAGTAGSVGLAGQTDLVIYDPETQSADSSPTGHSAIFGMAYALGAIYGFNHYGQILRWEDPTLPPEEVAVKEVAFWGASTNPAQWLVP